MSTDEPATCQYASAPGTPFGAPEAALFSDTGGVLHTASIELDDGRAYVFHVRCEDLAGNANGEDYLIEFSIADPDAVPTVLRTASTTASGELTSSTSVELDCTGGDTVVIGVGLRRSDGDVDVDEVTVAGAAASAIGTTLKMTAGGSAVYGGVAAFVATSPPSGTQTITVTTDAPAAIAVQAVLLRDVRTSDPVGELAAWTGESPTPSVAVSSDPAGLVLGAVGWGARFFDGGITLMVGPDQMPLGEGTGGTDGRESAAVAIDWAAGDEEVTLSYQLSQPVPAAVLGLAVRGVNSPLPELPTVTVDCTDYLQTMDGFGNSTWASWETLESGLEDPDGNLYRMTATQRRDLLWAAISELGISHGRVWLPLSGSIEPTNDNADPAVRNWAAMDGTPMDDWSEFLTAAIPQGFENWIATPGIPRTAPWLRDAFARGDASAPDEYAEWAASHILYLKDNYGLEPRFWSMHNEPDGKAWLPESIWDDIVRSTGRRFEAEGISTKFLLPDTTDANNGLAAARAILEDPELRRYVGALGYHHYWTAGGDGPEPWLLLADSTAPRSEPTYAELGAPRRAWAELGADYGIPSWSTETAYYPNYTSRHTVWEVGRARAAEVHLHVEWGASAFNGMLMMDHDVLHRSYRTAKRNDGHDIVLRSDGTNLVRWYVTKSSGVITAHYARYIRPGSRRLGTVSPDERVWVTAYADEAARRYVAVVLNNDVSERTVSIVLEDPQFPLSSATGLMSDESRSLVAHPVTEITAGVYEATLPSRSIATFVWSEATMGPLTLPRSIEVEQDGSVSAAIIPTELGS